MSPKSILIIKPGSFSDIIHTLPAIASLRAAHPHAKITWVINPELAPLLRGNPDVNHVYFVARGEFRGLGAPENLLTWLKNTGAIRPDLTLDFQGVMGSALTAKISGAKDVRGMSSAAVGVRWLYDRIAQVDRYSHPVERHLSSPNAQVPRLASRFDILSQVAIHFHVSIPIRPSFFFILLPAGKINRFQTP